MICTINLVYIKLTVFILDYLQNKPISAIENNCNLTLIIKQKNPN